MKIHPHMLYRINYYMVDYGIYYHQDPCVHLKLLSIRCFVESGNYLVVDTSQHRMWPKLIVRDNDYNN